MLVLVQYEVDSTTEVVQPSAIRGFRPTSVADFDGTKDYEVWWHGDDSVSGGYYEAKVLHMTETLEEMEMFQSKRPRKTMNLNETKGKKRTKGKAAPSTKQLRLDTQGAIEAALAAHIEQESPSSCMCCSDGCDIRAELEKAEAENADLKKELHEQNESFLKKIEKLKAKLTEARQLNSVLQNAVASKIFESGE
ncbi:uncharacterized protein LOC125943705 [Dermacentor silvarum]|uniref:uncharacterized protein LOC125943705 n=1 Tax=Dermacentor silvarum TaxID=543639 RepID=UPI0021011466|nr:uncharacterized protein LOC125943705 [Dermacentor silvarum]